MDIDNLVMLAILQLHRGKSIKYVEGKMSDIAGVNDINMNIIYDYLLSSDNLKIGINNLNESIARLQKKGLINIVDGRICPSIGLIRYFVEILQYEDNKTESIRMLSNRISLL